MRSSRRIVSASLPFTLEKQKEDTCFTTAVGPPIKTYIFNHEGDGLFDHYAEETIKAIQHAQHSAIDLSLHNRVLIVVPDEDFKEKLEVPLKAKLDEGRCITTDANTSDTKTTSFDLISAAQAARCVDASGLQVTSCILCAWSLFEGALVFIKLRWQDKKEQIVLDALREADGLERLFCICVGLDAVKNDDNDQAALVRSMLYRGLTRAQMMAMIVNQVLPSCLCNN